MNPLKILFSTPNQNLFEGAISEDFKIGTRQDNLMRICFSPLANLTLYIVLFFIWFDPSRYLLALQKIFGDQSSVLFFLLDGQLLNMIFFAAIFGLLQWFFQKEFLWTGIVFYFLNKSELHINLALAAVIGITVSRSARLLCLQMFLESRTKGIWRSASAIQLFVSVTMALVGLVALDWLQRNSYFSGSITENRFEFLLLVVVLTHAGSFAILSTWGHFYFQRKSDPSFLPIYFSTANWLKKIGLRSSFRGELLKKTEAELASHMISLAQVQEMKDQSLGVRVASLETVLNKQLVYLKTAASRLTIG